MSGKVTAQLEMAQPGVFSPKKPDQLQREGFSKKATAKGYTVVADTKGTLLWPDQAGEKAPLVVMTSEQVSTEYLAYLDDRHISWIACGKEKINLARAVQILAEEFGVSRIGIVGGGTINAGFLDAGLLDEISMLIAPGIDGRGGMGASFDGLAMEKNPVLLKLEQVTPYEDGAVWLRYSIQK